MDGSFQEIPSHRLRDDEQPPEGVDEVQDLKVRVWGLGFCWLLVKSI